MQSEYRVGDRPRRGSRIRRVIHKHEREVAFLIFTDNGDKVVIDTIQGIPEAKDYLISQMIKDVNKPIEASWGEWSKYGFKKSGDIWVRTPSF